MTLEEFTNLTGYSPITVAQAVLYRQNRKPAIMARKMGLVYERSDLVRLAAPRKPRAGVVVALVPQQETGCSTQAKGGQG